MYNSTKIGLCGVLFLILMHQFYMTQVVHFVLKKQSTLNLLSQELGFRPAQKFFREFLSWVQSSFVLFPKFFLVGPIFNQGFKGHFIRYTVCKQRERERESSVLCFLCVCADNA